MSTTVPEIWFKSQRVVRTIVQALIVLVPTVNGVAAAALDYLQTQADVVVPDMVFVWLNVAVAVTALIMGLVARIMAVPGVNDILARVGLGSVPRKEIGNLPDPGTSTRAEYRAALNND